MDRRLLILILGLAAAGLAFKLVGPHDTTGPAEDPSSAASTTLVDEEERARQKALEEELGRARVAQLEKCEALRRQRDELGVRQEQELSALQSARQALWNQVLQTNWQTYSHLRKQAESSSAHTVPCAFCDGRGKMSFCVVCAGTGRCARCEGTGKDSLGPCPACLGTGKCYLCAGTGKMPCLFCDDGLIYAKLPPPPSQMPLPRNTGSHPQFR